jgi:hypothetical protein
MKRLFVLFFVARLLLAQKPHDQAAAFHYLINALYTAELDMELSRVNKMTVVTDKKIIDYYVVDYAPPPVKFPPAVGQTAPPPVDLGSANLAYSVNAPVVTPFYNQFSGGQAQFTSAPPSGSVAIPSPPPNPQVIFLDGTGNSIVALDMLNLKVVSEVVVPSTTGPLGIRPTSGGSGEAWVANGAVQVSVVDLGAQKLVTNILTPSIPAGATTGIVFTPDGATAFETVKFFSKDSTGNLGALVVFDAINRKIASTLLLKAAPTALLMAPDGLTAYVLSDTGTLTYYDVLSGTADLSVSTFTPGVAGGYGPSDQAFIHPDGTRLFWNLGVNLVVFDLPTHKIVNQFGSGLPTNSGTTMSMCQDGGRVYFSNAQGDVVVLDTLFGHVLGARNSGTAVSVLGGPPLAP